MRTTKLVLQLHIEKPILKRKSLILLGAGIYLFILAHELQYSFRDSSKYRGLVQTKEKVCIIPSHRVDYITLNLWNGVYHSLNFSKPVKLSPKAVLKNHSKSQKNHKIKKYNCVGLQMSRYTLWTYNMVYFITFFIAMKKSIDLKL